MEINITNTAQLKHAIALLKADEKEKKALMVDQFHETYEGLKPMNLIKNAFKKVGTLPDIANQVIGTSVGLGAGMLSKKLLVGKTSSILKKVFGSIIEFTVAGAVAKNATGIKEKGIELIKKALNGQEKK